MTRNEKFQEIFSNKIITKEKTYLIGDDFHLDGVIDSYWKDVVTIYNKSIGLIDVNFDKITSII